MYLQYLYLYRRWSYGGPLQDPKKDFVFKILNFLHLSWSIFVSCAQYLVLCFWSWFYCWLWYLDSGTDFGIFWPQPPLEFTDTFGLLCRQRKTIPTVHHSLTEKITSQFKPGPLADYAESTLRCSCPLAPVLWPQCEPVPTLHIVHTSHNLVGLNPDPTLNLLNKC